MTSRLSRAVRKGAAAALLSLTLIAALGVLTTRPAAAQSAPAAPTAPVAPTPVAPGAGDGTDSGAGSAGATGATGATDQIGSAGAGDSSLTVSVPDPQNNSSAVTLLIAITILSVAPSILVMMTGFTRILVVLSLVRSALGLGQTPPNQLIAGLALILSLFVMAPVLTRINDQAVQPYLNNEMTATEALDAGQKPLKEWMLAQTRDEDLSTLQEASGEPAPEERTDVSLRVLVPAFVLSELKTAFILGFLIYVPFIVIDLVVSSVLMSLGMMMLPPSFVSLPLKLLLFIMANGWVLVTGMLLTSFRGT